MCQQIVQGESGKRPFAGKVGAPANELSIEVSVEAGQSYPVRQKLRNAHLLEYETEEGLESKVVQSLVNASVGVHGKLGHQPEGAKGRGGLEGNGNLPSSPFMHPILCYENKAVVFD